MVRALQPPAVRVLIVDATSPDGTGELADRLAAELDFVDVLHRERKEGLGPAYLAAFRHVLAAGADLVLEMDCDFSHDPADVPRLIAAAADADLVLGSRYVAGGGLAALGAGRRRGPGRRPPSPRPPPGPPAHDPPGRAPRPPPAQS